MVILAASKWHLRPLQRLFNYGHQYIKQIRLAIGASILNKIFDLAPPVLIGIAVDVVIKQQDSIIARLGVKDIYGQFLILSLLTVITWILESLFEYCLKLLWRNLGQNVQHKLRLDAYKHLQELELAYFEERSTSALMSILSDDINQLERFLDVGANDIIQVTTTIEILARNTIAIVGSTGSGKSTLVKLLLRFYEVENGKITLDGIDLQQLNLRDLRRCIGLVSQDVFLFHGTVAENIAYGTFSASNEDIIMAAKIAEAHDFIMNLPQGYETIVGEMGQKLSGGQRQRIAIARAVLKDPPILILDEATSAVDNEPEAAIQRSLERITVNRTTIAIAHRLSTIRNADCIYVMEHGKLVEAGTHEQLLDKNGIYASFWSVQSGLK